MNPRILLLDRLQTAAWVWMRKRLVQLSDVDPDILDVLREEYGPRPLLAEPTEEDKEKYLCKT